MSGVPDQAVAAKVKYGMQRKAQFDDAQVRRKVCGPRGDEVAEHFPHFRGQMSQLGRGQTVKVLSRLNGFENLGHGVDAGKIAENLGRFRSC